VHGAGRRARPENGFQETEDDAAAITALGATFAPHLIDRIYRVITLAVRAADKAIDL